MDQEPQLLVFEATSVPKEIPDRAAVFFRHEDE